MKTPICNYNLLKFFKHNRLYPKLSIKRLRMIITIYSIQDSEGNFRYTTKKIQIIIVNRNSTIYIRKRIYRKIEIPKIKIACTQPNTIEIQIVQRHFAKLKIAMLITVFQKEIASYNQKLKIVSIKLIVGMHKN